MRVAALFDIHGNLPALEAVLDEIRDANVAAVVAGGDVVPGPMAADTLGRLRQLDVPVHFIHGNTEVALLSAAAGRDHPWVPEEHRPLIRWAARQFGPDDQRFVAGWPLTVELDIPPLGRVLFCHATPRDANEIFTRVTPEARLLPIFDGVAASTVVCGHTHMQFDRRVGATRVVNAGSVGMPFGRPGAAWALLGPDVQLKHTPYDLAGASARIRRTDYLLADDFARSIVQPMSEAEMIDRFEAAVPVALDKRER